MMTEAEFLRRDKAAEYLRNGYGFGSTGTLAKLAVQGGGPQFRLIGRWPVYTPSDLDAWAKSRMSAPGRTTAEVGSITGRRSAIA